MKSHLLENLIAAGVPNPQQPEPIAEDAINPAHYRKHPSGIECIERLKAKVSEVRVLVFTVYEDSEQIFQALQAGASGYLLKRTSPERLIEAIKEVKAGGAPMTPEVAIKVVQSFRKQRTDKVSTAEGLTPREEQILRLLADGYVTKEIASNLGIAFFTAQNHLKKIYEKLHVHSRTEAVIKYLR